MDIKLPSLGENADSGVVVQVLVQEGDLVQNGQTILELENEKAVAPIPASTSGRVQRIHVKAGDKISVGHTLITLSDETGTPLPQPPPVVAPPPLTNLSTSTTTSHFASPSASSLPPATSPSLRRMARDLGIDLTRVRGSEAGGRIILEDLRLYIQQLQQTAFSSTPQPAGKTSPSPPCVESIDFSKWGSVEKKPLTSLRKTIARRMTESWNSVPRVTQFDEADVTEILSLRKKHSASYQKAGGRLTLTPFIIRAVCETLKQHPIFNASLDEIAGELVLKQYIHLGIAVDTEAGLMVPVLRDADRKTLLELAIELERLSMKARDRTVAADDLKGGSFTISNQGGIAGSHFTPIINTPEVAILGIGRASLKPVVKDRKIISRTILPICVSYDHRVIDGGAAARFTHDIAQFIENFPVKELKLPLLSSSTRKR